MKRIIVVGGGVGGLSAAGLLGAAGHQVTVIEASEHLGGKSWRIELAGQSLDTGPSLVTFPSVWDEVLKRFDTARASVATSALQIRTAAQIAGIELERLPNVGTYHWRGTEVTLPVPPDHPWFAAWLRFEAEHGALGHDITQLLTIPPMNRRAFPALRKLALTYRRHLTTLGYLNSLHWMPEGLRETIAIHTLNAGVGPSCTPALYASMPAVMARDGVFVPRGGVNELVGALQRLGTEVGVRFQTGEPVTSISPRLVVTGKSSYPADFVVSGVDSRRLDALLAGGGTPKAPRRLSCSAVGIYAVLGSTLPPGAPRHSVLMPDQPAELYAALESGLEPNQTMSFVNYYPAQTVNRNNFDTLALLLTSPANDKNYRLDDPFVTRELARATSALGLGKPIEDYFANATILDPAHFAKYGSARGALYGALQPIWMSGPFHRPPHHSFRRPWLWRVGASVHPGGGLPAVMGGALMVTEKLLKHVRGIR